MASTLNCWKCLVPIKDVFVPLERLAQCPDCSADLHVCRMCRFYDVSVAESCREPVADTVFDKQRANFCGYLELTNQAHEQAANELVVTATEGLNALFGLESNTVSGSSEHDELKDLFGLSDDESNT